MINFSSELNSEQLAVVEQGAGPCLVLAGAGSGKTRTITYRVAYLLEQGVAPENILLVTFTNKAAAEMKQRVQKITGLVSQLPWSGTFHHIGYRILRQNASLLGYRGNFTVLDSDDSESIIKLCIKEVRPGDGKKFPSASAVAAVISYARNAELTIDLVIEKRFLQWEQFTDEIKTIASDYAKRKKEANAMDFDDLLTNLLLLLQNDNIRGKFATQFQYVLVDEYQDTNHIQASIIRAFCSEHNNVLVVGDDAQSIYSFRAADIQNILGFTHAHPGAKIFKLETNYRSTEEIVEIANNVIANNRDQYQKQLRAVHKGEMMPQLFPQVDQQAEGNFIAKKIAEYIAKGTPPEEIAVLFRAAHHSQMLEVELVSRGIAYDYRGGVRFFERAHIKDILAYLRILNNLADTAAWLRVLTHEEGIGPAAAEKVTKAIRGLGHPEPAKAGEGSLSFQESDPSGRANSPQDDSRNNSFSKIPDIGRSVLGAKAQTGWNSFLSIWEKIIMVKNPLSPRDELGQSADRAGEARSARPTPLISALLTSSYRDYLEAEYVDSRDRMMDIKQLAVFAERYENLEEFLADATLQESFRAISTEDKDGTRAPKKEDKIILSTIHQAKGLEWSVVFIINLSSGAFPSERALREDKGIEEERRLFYVAVTRAKKYLYLTYPMAGGSFGDFLTGPSLFLDEINPRLLEDHSFLSTDATVLNDSAAGVRYVSEDEEYNQKPKKIRPGSLLVDIDDL